jgi:hypothetical protein
LKKLHHLVAVISAEEQALRRPNSMLTRAAEPSNHRTARHVAIVVEGPGVGDGCGCGL